MPMVETKMRFTLIEKEALATTWACEHFPTTPSANGCHWHRPQASCFSAEYQASPQHLPPPRVLHFRLQQIRFDYSIVYIPRKLLYTADTLFDAPQAHSEEDLRHSFVTEAHIAATVSLLQASEDCLDVYHKDQIEDPTCAEVISNGTNRWLEMHTVKGQMQHYWQPRHYITIGEGLALFQSCAVVLESLQHETFCKIHQDHQSSLKWCLLRVSLSVWWQGVSTHVEVFVKKCPTCMHLSPPVKETIIPSALPTYP